MRFRQSVLRGVCLLHLSHCRYLMVTAGSVLIRSGEVPAHEVLLDLLELCKGVQHPTRGLFLRYFLVQSLKVSA